MVKKNPVVSVEVFRGIAPQTQVFFHHRGGEPRRYVPTQTSLDRLEPFLEGGDIYLDVDGIIIHKWF